ncbi:MAG: hypothetical protein L2C94_002980 [Aigarchaeota archaeon]|nr:hypothetical protein [Candidatus Wolframiiraptor gerlachensis]
MVRRVSRRGLSPLLAIIIGLVVTIVAGILLAQLYFSYAATLSSRPAANIEYVDLVVPTGSTTGTLVISIKNTGNIYIESGTVKRDGTTPIECSIPKIYPGGVNSTVCSVPDVVPGQGYTFTVSLSFADKSNQTLAVVARARTA